MSGSRYDGLRWSRALLCRPQARSTPVTLAAAVKVATVMELVPLSRLRVESSDAEGSRTGLLANPWSAIGNTSERSALPLVPLAGGPHLRSSMGRAS